MNKARPIPIGAMKVDLCFSAANMKMQKMSIAVKNISMKTPRLIEVPGLRRVRTASGPGKVADTTPAADMAPNNCARMSSAAVSHGRAPMRAIATVTFTNLSVQNSEGMYESHGRPAQIGGLWIARSRWLTAGLKRPPETRKKTQTLTVKEKPNASEMYINDDMSMLLFEAARRLLAVCVAAKAKKRNRNVPMNSPKNEMSRWRVLFGSHPSARLSPGRFGSSVYVGFISGKT